MDTQVTSIVRHRTGYSRDESAHTENTYLCTLPVCLATHWSEGWVLAAAWDSQRSFLLFALFSWSAVFSLLLGGLCCSLLQIIDPLDSRGQIKKVIVIIQKYSTCMSLNHKALVTAGSLDTSKHVLTQSLTDEVAGSSLMSIGSRVELWKSSNIADAATVDVAELRWAVFFYIDMIYNKQNTITNIAKQHRASVQLFYDYLQMIG